MPDFDDYFVPTAAQFSDDLRSAVENADRPGLGAGPDNADLTGLLTTSKVICLVDGSSIDDLTRCGLWLLAGDLDRSHSISQDEPSREGSFWHGIMHRREGDYSNAAYWFRRVGEHPVIERLTEIYGDDYSDPYDFIDAVAAVCRRRDEAALTRLLQIQWTEWQLLVQYCMSQ